VQAYVQRGIDARYRIDSIETLSTVCSGDFAYVITRYRSTSGNQKAMGVNLVVMRKIEGKWLIVAHESAVPDPATAIQSLTPAAN
jgi:ketosteroid isomerase-like protein